MDLAAAASLKALAAVGLKPTDVDAVFVALPDDPLSGLGLAEYLGARPKLTDNNRTGGSSFFTHAIHAALALDAGECDAALIAYGSNQRSAAGKLITSLRTPAYEAPYRLPRPIGAYAMVANRYMFQYGATRDAFAEVAIAARRWAQLNPDAFMRDELTREAYFSARMVADPLSVRDCCLVTDGAAAVVMTRADQARELAAQPVHLLGGGAATGHRDIAQMSDLTVTAAVESGCACLRTCGCTASRHRRGGALRRLHNQHFAVPRRPRLLQERRGGRLRGRRPHRAGRRATGQHQRRRAFVHASRHVRPVHDRRSSRAIDRPRRCPPSVRREACARTRQWRRVVGQATLVLGGADTL